MIGFVKRFGRIIWIALTAGRSSVARSKRFVDALGFLAAELGLPFERKRHLPSDTELFMSDTALFLTAWSGNLAVGCVWPWCASSLALTTLVACGLLAVTLRSRILRSGACHGVRSLGAG